MKPTTLYVLVHIVFHDVKEEKRKEIYEYLKKKNWKKLINHELSTTWEGIMKKITYEKAFDITEIFLNKIAETYKIKINYVIQVGYYHAREF